MHNGKYTEDKTDEEDTKLRLMREEAEIPEFGVFTPEIEDLIKS